MKVLLTGANGFVGSHVLDRLVTAGHDVAIMIRRTSDTRFIERHLPSVEIRYAGLGNPKSLAQAVRGVSCVVHCAAVTKALRRRDYFIANADGTRNLVEACNRAEPGPERFVHVSSLAVSGPGTAEAPVREDEEPRPVTPYGESKLEAERHVIGTCRAPFTILRPAAVYGPRDRDFLLAFRTVSRGWAPLIGGGRQPVSLAYVEDVAEAVLLAVKAPGAAGGIYHVAHPVAATQRDLLLAIGDAVGRKPTTFRLPGALLYPVCALQGLWARVTGRVSIMNLSKVPEYRAPGWVCSTEAARERLGFEARTGLQDGLQRTVEWYRHEGWL